MENETTPYIGFSNDTLGKCLEVHPGFMVRCRKCKGEHPLIPIKDDQGNDTTRLMLYRCGKDSFLGAVEGRLIIDVPADCSGRV